MQTHEECYATLYALFEFGSRHRLASELNNLNSDQAEPKPD
jgi:hypothetical protein